MSLPQSPWKELSETQTPKPVFLYLFFKPLFCKSLLFNPEVCGPKVHWRVMLAFT